MATLHSAIVRTALIDYRAELTKLYRKYPALFKNQDSIKAIDDALIEIEGNITTVSITPATCRM